MAEFIGYFGFGIGFGECWTEGLLRLEFFTLLLEIVV
jgi:hypothetical protein